MLTKLIAFVRWSALGCLLLLLPSCYAQFNSSVEGTVTDQSGAAVANARVVLHSTQTGIDLSTMTQSTGLYRFNAVGPGDYEVIVAAKGFNKTLVSAHVDQDQVAAVNVALALGGTTTTVRVSGQVNTLDPDETRLQTTLEANQIENLPLQNGSVLQTVQVAPGVTGIDEDRNLWAVSIGDTVMNAQANGRPSGDSTYQLDGVSIESNSKGNTSSLYFAPADDMVQEVALEVNSYAVDYGASSSMRINITTKGGTNNFHGSFTDRYSGRGLNAIADFSAPELPNSRRWYEGAIGGPIFKDKTFFFFSFLHQTQLFAASGVIHYATNEFTGTWAPAHYPYLASAPVGQSQGANVQNLLASFPVGPATGGQTATIIKTGVTDYASNLFSTSTPGVCAVPIKNAPFYLGHEIGSNPIDCTMEIVDNGLFNQTPRVNGFQINGRLDQLFRGGKDRVYGAYLLEPEVSDFIKPRPGFNSTTPAGTRYLNFNYTHLFTPNLVNQAIFGYTREYFAFTSSPANDIPFLSLMIGSGNDATDYFGTPGAPSFTKQHDYQFLDNAIWTHGRHNVKAGFSASHEDSYDNAAGWLSKAEVPIYFGWSDMLDDHPWSYSLDTLSGTTGKFLGNIQGDAVTQFGLYAQDDWKIGPNLLVTLGVRWDDYGNPIPSGNGVLPFYNINSPSGSSLRQNIITNNVSTQQVPRAFSQSQNKNFLPRAGFAWSPFPSEKLTVHGGVGFYEDAFNVSGSVTGLSINSPSYLNTFFCATCIAPLNTMDPRNFYGTSSSIPPPYGNTYSYPSLTPQGVDSHGEIILNEGGVPTTLTSSLSGVDPKLKPQKTALYSLQVEKELFNNLVVGVGYSGSRSWDQFANGDYNSYPGDQIKNNGKELRLSQEWAGVSFNSNLLSSNYNALLFTARENYHNLSWQASYTFAKTLTYGGLINDIYDASHYYGPATGSVPRSFNGSVAYELPGRQLNNLLERALLGGWELSSLVTAQTGTPFSLETTAPFVPISSALPSEGGACTTTNCGTDITNPTHAGTYLANGLANSLVNIPAGLKKKGYSRAQWKYGVFSNLGYTFASTPTYAIAANGPGFTNPLGYGQNPVYSNQGYNSFYGPGYLEVDSSVHKKVYLPWFERQQCTMTFGLEGSNVINRVNLGGPASTDLNTVSTNGLGVSQSANQARILQVMGRLEF